MSLASDQVSNAGGSCCTNSHRLEPGVTVIIPTFNRRCLVADAIDSALSQNVEGLDVVVVDDGSTDDTDEYIRSRYSGRPVVFIRNDRSKGPAGARNCGMARVRRQFTAFLDSDDCFLPSHLEASIGVMLRYAHVDVVFGPARYECDGGEIAYMAPAYRTKVAAAPVAMDETDISVFSLKFFEHLIGRGCFFNLSSVVFRTLSVDALMCEQLRMAEDYEFWMRLATKHVFAALKTPQIVYRIHSENLSLEGDSSDAMHSSALLGAYKQVLGYANLSRQARRLVRRKMAEVLFDWGYNARREGRFAEALLHHVRSIGNGILWPNVLSVAKLGVELTNVALRNRG